MDGSHYILLSECIERFQCAEFFKTTGITPYRNKLESLKMMKKYVARKNRDESKVHLNTFMPNSSKLIDDFNAFQSKKCVKSETFTFW